MRMHRPRIRTGPCLQGQVLVYTVLVMTVTISLIAGLIQAAVYSEARAEADMACRLASESGFSGYHDSLFETYGILALKDNGHLEQKVRKVILGNLQENSQVTLNSVDFDQITAMTDLGGLPIREEVAAYMKNGALSEAVQAALSNTEIFRKAETAGKVMESVTDTQEAVMELEEKQLQLLPYIEGIEAGDGTIRRQNGRAAATGETCVKTAVGGPVSRQSVGVSAQAVFDAVNSWPDGYVSIPEMIIRMRQALFDSKPAAEYSAGEADAAAFESARQRAQRALSGGAKAAESALQILSEETAAQSTFLKKLSDARDLLERSKENMDSDLYSSAAEALDETEQSENTKGLIDTDKAQETLRTRKAQLNDAAKILSAMTLPTDSSGAAAWMEDAQKLNTLCQQFDNSDLVFDYSGIDFDQTGSGTGDLKGLIRVLTGKQTELILQGKEISAGSIGTAGRAGEFSTGTSEERTAPEGDTLSNLTDDALYNEYLFLYFDSYTDTLTDSSNPKTELAYPIEYILFGENSDRENLSHAVNRLLLIRQGLNLGFLIMNPEKSEEAMILASEMTGFTGSLPIVKTTQMLILAAWSYAEAIVDLRVAFDGKKISAVKSDANWHTSLQQLFSLQLPEGTEDPHGLEYEDFLRILLMTSPLLPKYYRTMGAMESGLIQAGEAGFRMSQYIFSFEGKAEFSWKPTGAVFSEPVSYSYG